MPYETHEPCVTRGVHFVVEGIVMRLWKCNVCCRSFALGENDKPEACPLCAVLFLQRLIDDVYHDAR